MADAKAHRYLIATIMANQNDHSLVCNAVGSICEIARNSTCQWYH